MKNENVTQESGSKSSELISPYSEEYQEIIGYIPGWIIRSGIVVFLIFLLVLVAGSRFIRFPDIITTKIVITANTPPIRIVARVDGKLQALFVQDKQKIKKDGLIAVIENPAAVEDVFLLKDAIAAFAAEDVDGRTSPVFEAKLNLGELQTLHESFYRSLKEYKNFLDLDYYGEKIRNNEETIKSENLSLANLIEQKKYQEEELAMAQNQFDRYQKLYREGIISENEIESKKSNLIQKKNTLMTMGTNIVSSKARIAQVENSNEDYRIQRNQQNAKLLLEIKRAQEELKSQIQQWEFRYVLKSPICGTVAFTKYWAINQHLKLGDVIFTVIPEQSSEIVGKVVLPIEGAGKVKAGQKVFIKLMDYPFQEYGVVNGIVSSKSIVSADNAYIVEVVLPHRLRTDFGVDLTFTQEMYGSCDIVTEDVSVFGRLFKKFRFFKKRYIGVS